MTRGRFVVVSGIDGAGKSTLSRRLVDTSESAGFSARVVKIALFANPAYRRYRSTLAEIGEAAPDLERRLRASLVTVETARAILGDLAPSLDEVDLTICDRYIEGTKVYLRTRGLPSEELCALGELVPPPARSFLLDVPLEVALSRLRTLGEYLDAEQARLLGQARAELLAWAGDSGACVVDATRPTDTVAANVWREVAPLLRT